MFEKSVNVTGRENLNQATIITLQDARISSGRFHHIGECSGYQQHAAVPVMITIT